MRVEKQNKEQEISVEQEHELDELINKYKGQKGVLITVLHQAQKIFGHLPREVLLKIALGLEIPFPRVYGVVSFYSLFNMKETGTHRIEICMGTACYVKGGEKLIDNLKNLLEVEPGEVSKDGRFTIETTRCKGDCSKAPIISIDNQQHNKVKIEDLEQILSELYEERS